MIDRETMDAAKQVTRWSSNTSWVSEVGGYVAYDDYLALRADLAREVAEVEALAAENDALLTRAERAEAEVERLRADLATATHSFGVVVNEFRDRAETAEADAAALRADIERHVALAATQANDIEALRRSCERGANCIRMLIARTPVRDVDETLAELDDAARAALGADHD